MIEPDVLHLAFFMELWMTRVLKRGEVSVEVDLGSAWKLFDNNNMHKSVSFYYGPIFRTKERVFWVETDEGGFVIDPEKDILHWSEKTGIHQFDLKNILQDPKNKYLSCIKNN